MVCKSTLIPYELKEDEWKVILGGQELQYEKQAFGDEVRSENNHYWGNRLWDVMTGTPKYRIVSVSFCVPANKQHVSHLSSVSSFSQLGEKKKPLCPGRTSRYKLDLPRRSGVTQAGLRQALGRRTSCPGPDCTCCVVSNYPRT